MHGLQHALTGLGIHFRIAVQCAADRRLGQAEQFRKLLEIDRHGQDSSQSALDIRMIFGVWSQRLGLV
ncbi:hypothetical protein D9M72_626900 [compost metagenome]